LIGILDGCLRHRTLYDEDKAWAHRRGPSRPDGCMIPVLGRWGSGLTVTRVGCLDAGAPVLRGKEPPSDEQPGATIACEQRREDAGSRQVCWTRFPLVGSRAAKPLSFARHQATAQGRPETTQALNGKNRSVLEPRGRYLILQFVGVMKKGGGKPFRPSIRIAMLPFGNVTLNDALEGKIH
jgi:hypothetical protein